MRRRSKPGPRCRTSTWRCRLRCWASSARARTATPIPRPARQWLDAQLGIAIGGRPAEWSAEEIYLSLPRPGGDAWLSIDRQTGAVEYESTSRGVVSYLNDLHKGRNAGRPGLVPGPVRRGLPGVLHHRAVPAAPACAAAAHDLAAGRPGPDDPAVDRPAADPLTFPVPGAAPCASPDHRPQRPAGHLAGLCSHPSTSMSKCPSSTWPIPPPVRGGVAGRRRPEGRGQPVCLVPADQQQRRPRHQWLPDLRQWWRKSGRTLQVPVDGVTGPTRPAGASTRCRSTTGSRP